MRHAFFSIALGLALCTQAAHAQGLSVSMRGGGALPLGAFAEAQHTPDAYLSGAERGFGMGLDVGLSLGRSVQLVAGFDRVRFDCRTEQCAEDGRYTLGGASAAVKLSPFRTRMLAPWIKGGVTFRELQGELGGGAGRRLTTDRAPGYELGLGADIPLIAGVALSPQARYVGQSFKYRIPGIESPAPTEQGVGVLSFDLGLSLGWLAGR
jgi:hypothetical protein